MKKRIPVAEATAIGTRVRANRHETPAPTTYAPSMMRLSMFRMAQSVECTTSARFTAQTRQDVAKAMTASSSARTCTAEHRA